MDLKHIRNFVITAHVDHGKSTLADRLLEMTGTVDARHMKPQYLDQLELERERGITIKMAPVRMHYKGYLLHLIDTPGHSDFSYEVSRALAAVEGAILLVDATKGIQAQTLANFRAAKKAGLTIVGAVNKIDLDPPQAESVRETLARLLEVSTEEIFMVSGKSGKGVVELLDEVIKKVPPPSFDEVRYGGQKPPQGACRALIFDSLYDDHKGILAYVRVVEGELRAGTEVTLLASGAKCKLKEIGCFAPELRPVEALYAGEIGYLATGLKEPALVKIGDTVLAQYHTAISGNMQEQFSLGGYREPAPVVFISFYTDGETKFEDLRKAFERLRLTDAALSFEPDANDALGRGLKAGFLGKLHFEIVASRIEREFGLDFLTSFPSIAFRVKENGIFRTIKEATGFPSSPEAVLQPMIKLELVLPSHYVNHVANLKQTFQLEIQSIETIGESSVISARMPLMELIRDFDDQLKSISAGYASFSYELDGESPCDVEKLEILAAGEAMPALTRIVFKKDLEHEARATVARLKELLPAEQFSLALQAQAQGRIIARETIPAMKKDLGNFGKNGGDRTRKMKLWKKQKEGKERLKERGRVHVPVSVFREILKK